MQSKTIGGDKAFEKWLNTGRKTDRMKWKGEGHKNKGEKRKLQCFSIYEQYFIIAVTGPDCGQLKYLHCQIMLHSNNEEIFIKYWTFRHYYH